MEKNTEVPLDTNAFKRIDGLGHHFMLLEGTSKLKIRMLMRVRKLRAQNRSLWTKNEDASTKLFSLRST